VSDTRKEDSIAEKLEGTRWEYRQRDDSRFLLDPIGQHFGTFCWDGNPKRVASRKREDGVEETGD
jgi:hypothetical protein